ncbi:hypothetical protein [Polynucleobacter sp. 35-46-11]|uniref:hypothetical protein n=1 Tax=Polynucleobacter sp. 35-46-11 TaxID=1970425 RepID=UPI0025FF3172|nr:hypothetical protein [Polynucleobacter sp. 35-46-11]
MLHISTAGHERANFNAALNVTASMQKALLCGVSVLACGVVLGGTPAAQAQTIGTSSASTVYSTGADITVLTNVVLSGTPFGIANATLTNSITNGGTVSNKHTGIYNADTLNAFSNTGTISGLTGVVNEFGGTIQTLTNSGSISGIQYGILNFGVINQLTNANTGVIATSGARSSAINNSGSIGRLTNNGTIAGGARGIYNYVTSNSAVAAYIGVLTNNGLISSRSNSAITNTGNSTIGVLSNTGTISGPGGIFNYGRADIGVLTNGTLTNGVASNALIRGGLYNAGTIGVLTNDGTI